MGYQQSFVLLGRFLAALRGGAAAPTSDEGVTVSRCIDTALASTRGGGWLTTGS
jgi:hypothetical protein